MFAAAAPATVPRDEARTSEATKTHRRAPTPAKGTATPQPAPHDPWRQRYGTRASFNVSAGPAPTTVDASKEAAAEAVAGIRVPVRVNDAIASAPTGPIIAVVQTTTKFGGIELPRGAEIHGRITGAQGPRILVDFTFAIVGGKNVPLKGIALGSDGRAGVPGEKNFGGVSDVAAGAASGAVGAALTAAGGLVPNDIARGAIQGGTGAAVNKVSRIDNEEELVVADRGARFFVYIEPMT
jgi:hypothetical protein